MSKIEEEAVKCYDVASGIESGITKDLCDTVCKYIGPNLFKKDASLVAYSDKKELETIRENFVKKKLNISDSDEEIDAVIKSIGEKYGMSVRNKKRSVVYALLMHHYGITSL